MLDKALVLIPTQPFLQWDPPLDLAGSSTAQGESLEGQRTDISSIFGHSFSSQPAVSNGQFHPGVQRHWRSADASWLLLQDMNAWCVLQQPWGCGLLGNPAKHPPAARRQCKKRQESELEKVASSHPCCSHVIFYPCFSKADHALEHLTNVEQSGRASPFLLTHILLW